MERFAAIAMLITLVVTLVVGGRLLLVARRTRMLPELLLGISLVASGVGQGFGQLGQRVIWTTPGAFATTMSALTFGFVVLGSMALFVVVWRIYHPGRTYGAWVCCLALPLLGLSFGMRVATGDFATNDLISPGMLLHQALRIALFSWASVEALHYQAKLRRRLVLGLADPVAMNQITMWGLSSIGMVGLDGIITWNLFVMGRPALSHPTSTALILFLALAVSLCTWLAFFPPQALRARLVARAQATTSG